MTKSVKQKLLAAILGEYIEEAKTLIESSSEINELKYASSLLHSVSACDPENETIPELLKESERVQGVIVKNQEQARLAAEERARQEAAKREEERAAALLAEKKEKTRNVLSWVGFFGFIAVFVVSVIILAVCNGAHSLEIEIRGDSYGLGFFVGLCIFAAFFVPGLACFCIFVAHHPRIPWTIPFPVLTLGIVIFTIATYAPLDSNFNPATTIVVQAVSKSQKSLTYDTATSEIAFAVENKGKYEIYSFSGEMTFFYSSTKYVAYDVSFYGGYEVNLSKDVSFTIEEPKNDCPIYNTSLKDMGIQLEIQQIKFKQFEKIYDFNSGIIEIKQAGENQ